MTISRLEDNRDNLFLRDTAKINRPQDSFFPPVTNILQSGLFGAILSAGTTGMSEYTKFKEGKKTKDEAISEVMKSGVQGATAMIVATFANHIVKKNPLLGIGVLVVGGVGAYVIAKNKVSDKANAIEKLENVKENEKNV